MQISFDRTISKILNESIFDENDIDLLDNDDNIFRDKGIEQTFNELIDYWKRKQWINTNTKFNLKKIQVQGNNILNNNIDDIVTFSFNNNDDYTEFVNSLLESDIKIISTLTWITFNKGFIAEDFGDLSYCFEANKLYINGGKFFKLTGIPKCKLLSFKNTELYSLGGIQEGVKLLNFNYSSEIDSVQDWSDLPDSVSKLEVYYSSYFYVTMKHLLHFGNMNYGILNKECNFFPDNVPAAKQRFFKNYIKNVFIKDNPNMKKKEQNEIIKHLQQVYHRL